LIHFKQAIKFRFPNAIKAPKKERPVNWQLCIYRYLARESNNPVENQMNKKKTKEINDFREWTPDFDKWPTTWMGVEEDLAFGVALMPWFAGFLQALYSSGPSRKTFVQNRDNLWILGGTIIKNVSLAQDYQEEPLKALKESVADDGILPDDFDNMTGEELIAFERMCRKFEKFLQGAK